MEKIIYKLVSILPNLSKILKELCIGKEISLLFVDYHQSVRFFRKCHSSQQCVSMMNRKWKKCLDNTEKWGTLWIDLSKSFACLYHDLSIMYVLMDLIK